MAHKLVAPMKITLALENFDKVLSLFLHMFLGSIFMLGLEQHIIQKVLGVLDW